MSSKVKRRVSGSNVISNGQANPNLTRRFSTSTEFNPDYSPVIAGLKRIAVLASVFIVVLVVLSFVLN